MMSISFIGNVTGSGGGSCELCAWCPRVCQVYQHTE
jgi:hypothetical protein